MTNQQKTIAFWIGSILGVVAVVFLVVATKHTLNTAATTNTVSFSGEGTVSAKPDIARLSFSIVTQSATSKGAQDANSTKSNEVTKFLKGQGIEDKDIKTSGYQIYPQQVYTGSSPRITGYQASQNFQVIIRNLDNANKVLDGIVAAGVNQVDQLQFDIDDPEQLKAQAREKAIADAKVKARQLESQIGINLGKIVNFQEDVGGYVVYSKMTLETDGRGGGGGGPTLPTGENEITVSVSITYQIK